MTHKIQHGGKGVWITLPNGYSLSIQYGRGNYCERRIPLHKPEPPNPALIESSDFELAIFYPGGGPIDGMKFVPIGGSDNVMGWIPSFLLGDIINMVSRWPSRDIPKGHHFIVAFRHWLFALIEEEKNEDE